MSRYTSNDHTTRSPVDLQAAKRVAAERFEAIAVRHLPPGYSVVRYRKNLSGYCDPKNKVIVVPRPRTRKALYIFLHECAHAHLHRNGSRGRVPRHVEELEAEQWACPHARGWHSCSTRHDQTCKAVCRSQDQASDRPRCQAHRSAGASLRPQCEEGRACLISRSSATSPTRSRSHP